MTTLPADRRVIHGRTHSRHFDASDFDPVQHYRRGNGRIRSVLLACAIGVALALTLFFNL